ncbi:TIGR03087 family PEP-CTERM/XrtA system glycosyltransferase [Emcibacter nanhaiensis]|uniref:TIGR03087 family PEP-CTERM/XrtA system glycosyltransferase n=1 Tax=Emcibacter nanhaiensis TaxID=1505037 RepID=A0A501PGZ9_9PROT|nr:TIGR03087 family PEP-CTERM/XrtA system glycosyltransferase [Emcibacter nanhaiensis]TPD59357.1 TIGR03087 family PEP-CTERM/XrtA system glycosyltransferase [Emcibacter nanhaiensis]
MNILFVSHRFPYPPTRGDKIRSFNMVRHLHESGHKVTVASLVRSDEEEQEIQGIKDHCHEFLYSRVNETWQKLRMVGCLLTTTPSSMGYFYSPELKAKIKQKLAEEKFDLIVVFSSSAAQYVEHVTDIPKILDYCDMDSQKWLAYAGFKKWPFSWGYWLEGSKLEAEEKRLARKFDVGVCATDFEVETLDSFNTGIQSAFFPNGVDSEFFKPTDGTFKKHNIGFVGRMDYYPNEACVISFCQKVLPLLREKYPDVTFTVVGAEPPASVRAMGELPGVTVTGTVDDVRTYVRGSEVVVAPLEIARGTQNKILEGMALGVPVISSQLAARGVDAVVGEHLLAASTPEEYAACVSRIFDSAGEREKFSKAGRERVLSHHNWTRAMKLFDEIIDGCLKRHAADKAA